MVRIKKFLFFAASIGLITSTSFSVVACKEKGHDYNFLVNFDNEKLLAGQNIKQQENIFKQKIAENIVATDKIPSTKVLKALSDSIDITLLNSNSILVPGTDKYGNEESFVPKINQSSDSNNNKISSLSFDIKFLDTHINEVEQYFQQYFDIKNRSWANKYAGKLSFNQDYYVHKNITDLNPPSANDMVIQDIQYKDILNDKEPNLTTLQNYLIKVFKKQDYQVEKPFKKDKVTKKAKVTIWSKNVGGLFTEINEKNFKKNMSSPTANFALTFEQDWQGSLSSPRPPVTGTYKYFKIIDIP